MQKATKSIKIPPEKKTWYLIDAEGKTLGRLASNIAKILMGKHKPTYTPNYDTGDYVVVINTEKVRVTGKKWENKIYRRYSGYIGGEKKFRFKDLIQKYPERIIIHAVKGMLPDSKLGRKMLKKLKVYAGPDHEHTAQQPVKIEVVKEK